MPSRTTPSGRGAAHTPAARETNGSTRSAERPTRPRGKRRKTIAEALAEQQRRLSRHLQELLSELTAAEGLEGLRGTPPAEEVRGPSGRRYGGESCGHLKPADWPRRWAIQLVEWRRFDAIILCVITANCFILAWASPLDPEGTAKEGFIHVRSTPPNTQDLRRAGPAHAIPSGASP